MADPIAAGLWGVVRIDDAPTGREDSIALHLTHASGNRSARGHDGQDPASVDELSDHGGQTILTGWIADRGSLARQLGLAGNASLAMIARAALLRFGAETPAKMLGEWSLFHAGVSGAVWLMQAMTARDRLFFAWAYPNLAFAPDAVALARLDWINAEIDPEAVGLGLGRVGMRGQLGSRSIYRGIEKLQPGCSIAFETNGEVKRHALGLPPPPRSLVLGPADAMVELEQVLRHVVRERLSLTGRPAILLSGGLDSSLLAAIAAQELAEPPLALCSVAPEGSGIADEFAFAKAVADRHGIELVPVSPAADADPYRPPPHVLAGAEMPLLSNRHCLTSSLQTAARASGATMLVNGTYGEMSLTARLPGKPGLRGRLGAVRRWLTSPLQPETGDFHARLAPGLVARLAEHRAAAARADPLAASESGSIGYSLGTDKAVAQTNAYFAGALRMDFPFRDLRLLQSYAGLPRDLAYALGPDRGPGRSIGKGLLPEEIRLRRRGMPADPGHYARLRAFAEAARGRIPAFRSFGIDEWLDLDWLDLSLARVARQGVSNVADANLVQLTALAAEYLTWLRGGGDHNRVG